MAALAALIVFIRLVLKHDATKDEGHQECMHKISNQYLQYFSENKNVRKLMAAWRPCFYSVGVETQYQTS